MIEGSVEKYHFFKSWGREGIKKRLKSTHLLRGGEHKKTIHPLKEWIVFFKIMRLICKRKSLIDSFQ